jgi:hypothetical protein
VKDVDEVVEAFIASPKPERKPRKSRRKTVPTTRTGNEKPEERPVVDEPVFVGPRTKGRPAVPKRAGIPTHSTTRAKP